MKAMEKDWYKKIWTLDIQDQSWVEDTKRQVDFLIEKLQMKGTERILDLACGFGRHSIELARRGYDVTGVDITPEYIEYATKQAKTEKLNAGFICSDIRNVSFHNEFDVVLNMADGAIGYLENEEENLKIFHVISEALKSGGRHFMDIMNGSYAETHFPCRLWAAGEKCLTLSLAYPFGYCHMSHIPVVCDRQIFRSDKIDVVISVALLPIAPVSAAMLVAK